jgi:ribosome maturation factor RimP
MITEKRLLEIITGHLEGTSIFVVDVLIRSGNRIFAFIDGDQSVTVEDCKALNRYIESQLDRETEDYDLTVSTAGADRPLKFPRQYPKHAGRELEVTTTEDDTITGKLVRADESGIELEHSVKSKKEQKRDNTILKYSQVKEAKIKLSFK